MTKEYLEKITNDKAIIELVAEKLLNILEGEDDYSDKIQ